MSVEYRLSAPRPAPRPDIRLDDSQAAVLEHVRTVGGPLQVLAGPGSGKTTTVVELVAERVESGALALDEILVLTFSRQAAQELRARIAARLGRTTATSTAMTFHGFCYALLRAEQDTEQFGRPVRLLSAPEQDAVLTELLSGVDAGEWPAALRPALGTRGMATELQRLLAGARAQGLDSVDLLEVARSSGRADWEAAAAFFDDATAVAAFQNTIDHTDLVFQAVRALDDPDCRRRWRERFALVVVDEYQDTDPLQVALLQALAGDGRDVVVVGDPYQSIYGFRGADVSGIVEFCETFRRIDGTPAASITLSRTNRYGAVIAGAVRSVVDGRGALGAVDGRRFAALRTPSTDPARGGSVQVRTFSSAAAEAEHVALLLREAHLLLEPSVPWERMAVLVRSSAHLDRLQRALQAAGVPIDVAGDELPLALEPAVRTLIGALHVAHTVHAGEDVDPAATQALLTGPLGGLDAGGLRRLGRFLRRLDAEENGRPRPSNRLVADALADPTFLEVHARPGPDGEAVAAAADVARLLVRAADQLTAGASAEEVLWTLWDGTSWPRRLRQEAESGGEGSARAHHDLDALCALFAEAARAEEREAHRSVIEVVRALEAQQIPADTLAQGAADTRAVRLMTAHRSKGLEWDLVVVAGVQDGEWPDTRLRSSLLQPERLTPTGPAPAPTTAAAVAEERRLFYVACSRARERLVVTAVASGSDDGDQPSRLVGELHAHLGGAEHPSRRSLPDTEHRPRRALSLRSAVAELRRIGENTGDDAVRQRVAEQLARLAEHPAGRAADPDRWWGLRAPTSSSTPLRPATEPLRLSGSQVSALMTCPLQWFLDHEAKGERATTGAQGFGSVVHAIAAEVVRTGTTPELAELSRHLDDVWDQLDYPAWVGRREKQAAVEALGRFLTWHADNPRRVVAAEHPFDVVIDVDGRDVRLTGSMDRVEVGDDGVHVVDLKTSKSKPTGAQLAEHPQLGIYQVAVEHGAAADVAADAPCAGAELVQLRSGSERPAVQAQAPARPDEPFFALEQLRRSVRLVDSEQLVAVEATGACGYCQFRRVCPAHDEGTSVVVRQRERTRPPGDPSSSGEDA